ncbi:juvenile hormone esterase-like [Danaus plexippus]|uniref:juvenile hormone esterase-like n=1 Tax=Danaus plexippus TaxID=13037 RepID=UPI002AAFC218|nr:juvenile hormone esterase-like [Danaus plexippus]
MRSILFLCNFFLAVFCELRSQTVRISQGSVRGYEDPEEGIFIFYNVPYATTPKGPNKFKAPLPAPVWNGTFEAINRQIVCPQSDLIGILPEYKIKDEECLVANIYVPDTKEDNLPVVVYIHGGAFVFGWGDLFTFRKFVRNQNIIVVSFNYRLSAHGFLCLGTEDAPGNAGMKDQIALLRWVKNNIKNFGGNPDDVTIHGCSAGATSVDLLVLSKMAKGLFKRGVADSGIGIASYAVQLNPIDNAKKYAKFLGYKGNDDISSLTSFYKSLPYEKLNSVQVMTNTDYSLYMTPCVERDLGEEMFLDDSPYNILKNGSYIKVPMLYGFSEMEGSFRLPQFHLWEREINANFSNFLPLDLEFKNFSEKELIANKVKNYYFGDKTIGRETIFNFVNFSTDIFITYNMIKQVKLHLEAGHDQIYFYEYVYSDNATDNSPFTEVRGASHCSQTFAVMDGFYNFVSIPYDEKLIPNEMIGIKEMMRKIYGNFMKTGRPIGTDSDLPQWTPMSCEWSEFMTINRTVQLRKSFTSESTSFWDKIYEIYFKGPKPPQID